MLQGLWSSAQMEAIHLHAADGPIQGLGDGGGAKILRQWEHLFLVHLTDR